MKQQIKNLVGSMQSFSREMYHRDELISEELALQAEMAGIVFGEEAEGKRVWDVYNRLVELNAHYKGVASDSLERFKIGCSFLTNEICGAISGRKGEQKALKSLQTLKCKHRILHNVELEFDGHRTELDAVVFTKKAVFIVEVKNTKRNVLIDENGNMQRYCMADGTYKFDAYLGLKMRDKEYVLRQALQKSDYKDAPIVSLVVFTDSTIKVVNDYSYITTCSLSTLPHLIEKNAGHNQYSSDEINNMVEAVKQSQTDQMYRAPQEIEEMKEAFWETILVLKEAQRAVEAKKNWFKNLWSGVKKYAAPTAAAVGALTVGLFLVGKR